ncbi:MAG: carboxypeptidase regulatory-like domain-containing protein [Acidobacteria bacterium]|nr:carboxypeptidase regulatory-like domain-containing protein [Acidobacteriota bacterium]
MRRWCLALCCCLLLLLSVALPPVALAQETTATILGTVTDQSGGVLPGVVVTLRHLATRRSFEGTTSTTGGYLVTLLPVGDYELTFSLAGFQPRIVRGVTLAVNDRAQINASLDTGGVSEVIEVTGRQLTQATTAVQSLIDARQVQELPINNRNFAKLAELAPGVSSDLADEVGVGLTSTMSLSVNGARRNAVNWLVDGVMNVDVGSNITLLSTPTLESIQQFKIITSSYAAEWPRSGGGIINVVTKSGASKFSGSGYEFFRNDSLNSNSYFRKLSIDPTIRDGAPELKYNNFGYTVGGPVLPSRERMFFFWSQEFRRVTRVPASLTALVPNPAWLTDPISVNYVAPGERDQNAVRLLAGYPTPNLAPLTADAVGRYQVSSPNINNTRQEVIRMDFDWRPTQRFWGRYTHDLSETRELGGLFFNTAIPGVAGTDTRIPGQVAAFGLRSIVGHNKLNELNYHFSSNNIKTQPAEGVRNTRSEYGVNIPEVFPENAAGLIPVIDIAGLSTFGANQLYRIQYLNHSITDNFSWQRGSHAIKLGGLATFEQKNENAASRSHGGFSFVGTTGGDTAFQNFLRGNAGNLCTGCSYTEAERDIDMQLRFNRFEFYAQDTWRPASRVTVDLGLRYSLYPPLTDRNNQLVTFDPSVYTAASAPPFANATGTLIDRTRGNLLDGIIRGGVNSPYGDGIYEFKKNAIQPRVGVAWDLSGVGATVLRSAFGIYYDQPLVGIFEQNSFTMPPIVNNVTFTNPTLGNPASGQTPTTTGVRSIIATATDFENPRTMQWNVGVTRRFAGWMTGEVSYVGSRGDNLIRPTDINYPDPVKVVALQAGVAGAVNAVRPYQSYGAITFRETTARSRYQGLLTSVKLEAGRNGSATLNYTLSRNRTDATNDRDAVDIPQNPANSDADYADARTDRRHIFNASLIYELPFFRTSNMLTKAVLGGWQLAGIANISSGQPVSRILVLSDTFRRGVFADLVGDPQVGERFVNGVPYWFNPDAFAPPAAGTFGNSGRAPFRQPGRHQWDLNLSKNFYPTSAMRLQLRAEFINAFDQRQWLADPTVGGLDNTCTSSNITCNVAADRFGQIIATRAAREIQFGIKLYW